VIRLMRPIVRAIVLSLLATLAFAPPAGAQPAPTPTVLDPKLAVRTTVSGLVTPVSVAFLGRNDMLVLEKDTGMVKRVVSGAVQNTALDLGVNNASERGLLGIALHPHFLTNGFVYLFWSCQAPPPPDSNPFFPTQERCAETPETGADTDNILAVPLLGNRVDRFVWDGSALTYDRNLIMLRSFQNDGAPDPPGQNDSAQPPRGNHDGGVLRFGPDGKLYIVVGDTGRRGQLQNLPCGPTAMMCPGQVTPDDQFGGPEPDDAHLTGVVLRLNDDGTTPGDNPFFSAGAAIGGEAGANIQKVFAYGLRNSFGMAFDPRSGDLWEQENGDDSFSELNRVEPGMNSGWVQIMGPPERINQFKAIETDTTVPRPFAPAGYFGLQQLRWPPTFIGITPEEGLSRMFMLPGAHYSAPELSWKFEVAPAGIGFLGKGKLGRRYRNDLFVGAARDFLEGGQIFHLDLNSARTKIKVHDRRLRDRVADNVNKWEITESESLLFGRNFGVGTDLQAGPNGNLFVVSLSHGAIYEIFRRR
jgi:glucose/arabinose dehydrogenase